MAIKFYNSLSYQLIKKIFLIYFLITFLITVVQVYFEYSDLKYRVKDDLIKLEEIFKPSLKQAIWDINQPQIEVLTQSIFKLPFVKKIEILDSSENLMQLHSADSVRNPFSHSFPLYQPYQGQTLLIGTVTIYSDQSVVIDQLKFGLMLILIGAMVKSLILMVLFLWAFKRYLSRPLNEFAGLLRKIEYSTLGESKATIKKDYGCEIEYMQSEFNTMIDAFVKQKAEYEIFKETHEQELEAELQKRTEKLEIANAELSYLASTDFLTSVNNRRSFYQLGEKYLAMAKRNNFNLVVLMLDLDLFKEINDQYGHEAGDVVLKKFAKTTSSLLRDSDIIGRLGGEEFAVVMMNITNTEAEKVAERILQKTREITCEVTDTPDHPSPLITVSIGMTSLTDDDGSLDCLLSKADKAVYQSKSNGRNQLNIF